MKDEIPVMYVTLIYNMHKYYENLLHAASLKAEKNTMTIFTHLGLIDSYHFIGLGIDIRLIHCLLSPECLIKISQFY